jgi:Putative silver efflux pump
MLERLLNATLRFSIARRWLIVAAAVVISLWGVLAVAQMPLDVFPPFAPPQVDVQTQRRRALAGGGGDADHAAN